DLIDVTDDTNVWFKGRWGDEYLYALLEDAPPTVSLTLVFVSSAAGAPSRLRFRLFVFPRE
ncbi:MAG: hypothetical protein LC749_05700, partial [Actinobacteria bacterium]|nr:hypothetical protein [Actinomycetota bacterium]